LATAKQLTPGIHAVGICLASETGQRAIAVSEAFAIASRVCHIGNIDDEGAAIRAEIALTVKT
jgi:hypothetical protein